MMWNVEQWMPRRRQQILLPGFLQTMVDVVIKTFYSSCDKYVNEY